MMDVPTSKQYGWHGHDKSGHSNKLLFCFYSIELICKPFMICFCTVLFHLDGKELNQHKVKCSSKIFKLENLLPNPNHFYPI